MKMERYTNSYMHLNSNSVSEVELSKLQLKKMNSVPLSIAFSVEREKILG